MGSILYLVMLYLLILSLFHGGNAAEESKIVNTKYGPIAGLAQKSPNFTVYEFLGIPYAKPPIGKLRFEKPEPVPSWTKTLEAYKFGAPCLQCLQKDLHLRRKFDSEPSEDCLFLNIWSPLQKDKLYPVLFYIHGGSYYHGSSELFPATAARAYASQGIVVVTINYRVGHWGFLTLNDTQIEPNLGLWDQNLALKWVSENIEAFAGNKSQITLWGDSAGASSVSQHSFSKYSRDLFHHGIQMSGSSFAAFARGTHTLTSSQKLIKKLGCSNRSDLKKCLQSKPINDFYYNGPKDTEICWVKSLAYPAFSPIYDGKFFEEKNPPTSTKKPTIFGLDQKEGRHFVLEATWSPFFQDIEKIKDSFNNESLYEFIEQWVTKTGFQADEREMATQEIFDFYSSPAKNGKPDEYIEAIVRIFSDFMFNVPSLWEAYLKKQTGYSIYSFIFDYDDRKWPSKYPVPGSTHTSETPFTMIGSTDNFTREDYEMRELTQASFAQFIKTGNPSNDLVKWPEFDDSFTYLSLKPKPETKNELFMESYDFWMNQMTKYSFDFIKQEKYSI